MTMPSRSEIMRWKRIARKAIAGERETIQALRSMRAGLYLAQGLQRDAYERVQESLIRASNIP